MLQLAEELSLVQVFKKIPEEQLQIPHTLIERYIQLRQSGPPEESISFRFKFLQGYTGLNVRFYESNFTELFRESHWILLLLSSHWWATFERDSS